VDCAHSYRPEATPGKTPETSGSSGVVKTNAARCVTTGPQKMTPRGHELPSFSAENSDIPKNSGALSGALNALDWSI
jgi:hypothetical protein